MRKQAGRELSEHVVNRHTQTRPELTVRLFGLSRRELGAYLVSTVLLAVLLSTAGAFDSDEISFPSRMAVWLIVSFLTVIQTLILDGVIAPRLPATPAGRFLAAFFAILGVIGLMTIELHLLKYTPLLNYDPDPLVEFLFFVAPPVGAMAAIIVLTRMLAPEGVAPRRLPLPPPVEVHRLGFRSAIAGYLPPPTTLSDWPGEPVKRVRAADHYLEVTTATGKRFLRGRMKDALRALAGADGVQPHRSWWVASDTITAARRTGRDYFLETYDGEEIPVARARIADLRKKGLL